MRQWLQKFGFFLLGDQKQKKPERIFDSKIFRQNSAAAILDGKSIGAYAAASDRVPNAKPSFKLSAGVESKKGKFDVQATGAVYQEIRKKT